MKSSSVLKCIISSILVMMLITTQAAEAAFTDTTGHWAETAINEFAENGYVNGKYDGGLSFAPDENMTRAEFATVVYNVFPELREGTINADASFPDVNPDDWFYSQVMEIAKSGVINGYEYGSFEPNFEITRQDAAVILYRVAQQLNVNINEGTSTFVDSAQFADYAADAISILAKAGIINGYEDGEFRPMQNITRAEVVAVLSRIKTKIDALKTTPTPTATPTVTPTPGPVVGRYIPNYMGTDQELYIKLTDTEIKTKNSLPDLQLLETEGVFGFSFTWPPSFDPATVDITKLTDWNKETEVFETETILEKPVLLNKWGKIALTEGYYKISYTYNEEVFVWYFSIAALSSPTPTPALTPTPHNSTAVLEGSVVTAISTGSTWGYTIFADKYWEEWISDTENSFIETTNSGTFNSWEELEDLVAPLTFMDWTVKDTYNGEDSELNEVLKKLGLYNL